MGYFTPVVPGVLLPIRESPLETLKSALWREAQNYPLFHLLQVGTSQDITQDRIQLQLIFRMLLPTSLSASHRFVNQRKCLSPILSLFAFGWLKESSPKDTQYSLEIVQDSERELFYDESRRLCDLRLFQPILKVHLLFFELRKVNSFSNPRLWNLLETRRRRCLIMRLALP